MTMNKIISIPQRRRATAEIYLDLMKIANGRPTSITRIMYAANLSWKPLQKYIAYLVNIGFIEEVSIEGKPHRCAYIATKKGKDFVDGMGKFETIFVTALPADYNEGVKS
jgi:predicted transcriptional regulator